MADFSNAIQKLINEDRAYSARSRMFNDGIENPPDLVDSPSTAQAVIDSPAPVSDGKTWEEMGRVEQAWNSVNSGLHNWKKGQAASSALENQIRADEGLNVFSDDVLDAVEGDEEAYKGLMSLLTEPGNGANKAFKQKAVKGVIDDVRRFKELQAQDRLYKAPEAMIRASQAAEGKGLMEGLSAAAGEIFSGDVLGNLIYLTGTSTGAMLPYMAMSAAAGGAIGSAGRALKAVGESAKNIRRMANAARGGVFTAGSYQNEFGQYLLDEMERRGLDPKDIESYRAILGDQYAEFERSRGARATGVSALDGISAAIAPVRLDPAEGIRKLRTLSFLPEEVNGINLAGGAEHQLMARKGFIKAPEMKKPADVTPEPSGFVPGVRSIATQAVVQGALGGAGEYVGTTAAGGEVNAADVLMEMIGEFSSAPLEVFTHSMTSVNEYRKEVVQAKEAKEFDETTKKVIASQQAIAGAVKDQETLNQWAERIGKDSTVVAFAQDLVDNGQIEGIKQQNPELAAKIEEAAQKKESVVLPVSEVVKIANTDAKLAEDIVYDSRVNVDGMTPRQAEEFEKNGRKEAEAKFERIIAKSKIPEEHAKQARKIARDIAARLETTGASKDLAKTQAMAWQAMLTMVCRETGNSPDEIMSRVNLSIAKRTANGVKGGLVRSPQGVNQAPRPDDKMSLLRRSRDFDTRLKEWANGEGEDTFDLGTPSWVLQMFGVDPTKNVEANKGQMIHVLFPRDVVVQVGDTSYAGKHGISPEELTGILVGIQRPLAVFESHNPGKKVERALVLLTELKRTVQTEEGNKEVNVVVPIRLSVRKYGQSLVINEVVSAYEKRQFGEDWFKEGSLLGYEKTKGLEAVRRLRSSIPSTGDSSSPAGGGPTPAPVVTAFNPPSNAIVYENDTNWEDLHQSAAEPVAEAPAKEKRQPDESGRVPYGEAVKAYIGRSKVRKQAIEELLKLMSTEHQKEFVVKHQAPSQITYQKNINDAVLRAAKKAGVDLSNTEDPVTRDLIVTTIINDALYAVNVNPTAIGWYDEKVRKCLAYAGLMFPELDPANPEFSKNDLFRFLYITATTSNGLKVKQNMNLAVRIYREYKKTGVMPAWGEGTQMEPMVKTLEDFVKTQGTFDDLDQMRKFFTTDWTVGQLLLMGYSISGEGKNETARGAAIIGPKIGNGFFSNLNGIFDALTMDRWFMRTFGRWTGTLIDFNREGFIEKVNNFRAILREVKKNKALCQWLKDNAGFDVEEALKDKMTPAAMAKAEMSLTDQSSPFVKLVKKTATVFMPASYRKEYGKLWGTKDEPESIGWRFYSALKAVERAAVSDKVAPGGSGERRYIRGLFNAALDVLHGIPGIEKLTMADLQAVLWYAEKKIYEATPVGKEFVEDYSAEDAPDYANVMRDIAKANGATDEQIKQAAKRVDDAIEAERSQGSERARYDSLDDKEKVRVFGSRSFGSLRSDKGLSVEDDPKQNKRGKTVYRDERTVDGAGVRSSDGTNAVETSSPDEGETGRNGGSVRVLKPIATWKPGSRVSAVLKANQSIKGRDEKSSAPAFLEYAPTEQAANEFLSALKEAKKTLGYPGACVEEKSVEELTGNDEWKSQCRIFLSKDKRCGFVIKNGDDLVSVFSAKGSNSGDAIVECAIAAGARRLDCFNTILPDFYARHGFVPVARLKFNREYAPYDWNYEYFDEFNFGEPDIIFMVYDNNRQNSYREEELDSVPYTDGEAYGEPYVTEAVERLKETNKVVEESVDEARKGKDKEEAEEDGADGFNQAPLETLVASGIANPVEGVTSIEGKADDAGGGVLRQSDPLYQVAYHGSPYKFDKFTLSHIGSGEGAQAHGWGLYFALDKRVAQNYREALTEDAFDEAKLREYVTSMLNKQFGISTRNVSDANDILDFLTMDDEEYNASELDTQVGNEWIVSSSSEYAGEPDAISIEEFRANHGNIDSATAAALRYAIDEMYSDFDPKTADQIVEGAVDEFGEGVRDALQTFLADYQLKDYGRVYEVEIPEDNVMLREDALYDEQPEAVRNAIDELFAVTPSTAASNYIAMVSENIMTSNNDEIVDRLRSFAKEYYDAHDESRSISEDKREYLKDKENELREFIRDSFSKNGMNRYAVAAIITNHYLSLIEQSAAGERLYGEVAKVIIKDITIAVRHDWGKDHPEFDYKEMTGREILGAVEDKNGGPEAAANAFKSKGVLGIRYRGGIDGECAVVWSEEAIQIRDYLEQSLKSGPRGTYHPINSINADKSLAGMIEMMETSDRSTFLHESAHAWLDIYTLLALAYVDKVQAGEQLTAGEMSFLRKLGGFFQWGQREGAIQLGVTDDVKTIVAGVQTWSGMTINEQRKMHELFAEGFESYLMTGEAPSNELIDVFRKFRAWLLDVYSKLANSPKPLSPEVKKLYDLLFVSEQEAADAEARAGLEPLFGDKVDEALMNEEEKRQYQELAAKANQETQGIISKAIAGVMRVYARIREKTRREIMKQYKDRVAALEAELVKEPRHIARAILKSGYTPEGGQTMKTKLSSSAMLKAGIQQSTIDSLAKKGFVAENGASPEQLAAMCGHNNATELIGELLDIETPNREATSIVAAQVKQETGEGIESYSRLQADLAAHNETRSRLLTAEYNAIARKLGKRQLLVGAARKFALEKIGGMKLSDVTPYVYERDEKRCAREAEAAYRKGDFERCLEMKRAQILNHEMARAALEVEDAVTKGERRVKRAMRSKTLYAAYQQLLCYIAKRHGIKGRMAVAALNDSEAYKVAGSLVNDGTPVDGISPNEDEIPPLLKTEKDIDDMTADEARMLFDSLRQLEKLGRDRLTIIKNGIRESAKETIEELRTEFDANADAQKRPIEMDERTALTRKEKMFDTLQRFFYSHIKISTWCRIFDGNRDGGPWWNAFIRSANDHASWEENERAKVAKRIKEILVPLFKGKPMFETDRVKIGNRMMSKGERIAAALNMGNASNLQRLVDGEPSQWTAKNLNDLQASLTEEEWRAVQQIWDLFEEYRPLIAEKEKRIYGVEPEWIPVEPIDVVLKGGKRITLRGGYYPVVYDPKASLKAQMHEDAAQKDLELKGAWQSATTRRSFVKSRVAVVKDRRLRLNMDALYNGLGDVIHDLAWHEWLINTKRLLDGVDADGGVRSDIKKRYGSAVVNEFEEWRKAVAAGDRSSMRPEARAALRWAAGNIGLTAMGFSPSSAIMQLTGIGYIVPRCGPVHTAAALKDIISSRQLWSDIAEKSALMRNRAINANRMISDMRNRLDSGREGIIKKYAYAMLLGVQGIVDRIAWQAGYRKAIAEGFAENDAIAIADQTVIDTQSSGRKNDLSQMENSENMMMFTVFYSWANSALNVTYASVKGEESKAKKLAVIMWAGMVMPMLDSLLRDCLKAESSGDDDGEDDDWLKKWILMPAGKAFEYHLGLFVLTREVSNAAGNMVAGETIYDYGGPAGVRGLGIIQNVMKEGGRILQGKEMNRVTWDTLCDLLGVTIGAPANQLKKAGKTFSALESGDIEPYEVPQALAFGVSGRLSQ